MACILKKKNNAFIRGFASRRLEIFIRHHSGALENLRLDPRPVLALRIFRSVVLDGIKAERFPSLPFPAWPDVGKRYVKRSTESFCPFFAFKRRLLPPLSFVTLAFRSKFTF